MITHNSRKFKIYKTSSDIVENTKKIANQINADFKLGSVCFLGILNGCIPFFSELIRNIKIPYSYSFLKISSYQNMERGRLNLELDISENEINSKDVIIVEDIVDSGNTVRFLNSHLSNYKPKSITVVSLLVKEESYELVDYYGFLLKNNKYVIGYGLDINNLFRDLNDIYIEKD